MKRFRYAFLPVVLLLSVMMPGCSSPGSDPGGTQSPTNTPTSTDPTPSSPTPTDDTPTPTSTTPSAPEVSITREAASFLDGDIADISSPSRNIACLVNETGVRCDVLSHSWTVPPTPDDCQHDYGAILIDESGPGHFICTSDAIGYSDNILPYGEAIAYKGFECRSSKQGMYCRSLRTGHGFLAAAERYAFF
jgi:hypothetical protein